MADNKPVSMFYPPLTRLNSPRPNLTYEAEDSNAGLTYARSESPSNFESRTKTAPPGTENLPLDERIRVYIEAFERGCSKTQLEPGMYPEDCPVCARAFVEAVKNAVDFQPEWGLPAAPDQIASPLPDGQQSAGEAGAEPKS
jgi:hypothetical protein